MAILRKVLSVGGGVIVAGAVIAGVEALGHAQFEGEGAFGAAVVGYGLGAATGAFTAARIADRLCSIIVTGLLAILATINLFAFPHPLWFAPAAAIALLIGWVVGSRAADMGRGVGDKAS
jgi:pimeloyl-ACP methyl ester carboxylesterase